MPRHNKAATPPEKRRTAKGSAVARLPSGAHTAESYAAFVALKARDGLSDVETVRKALKNEANR